jgi:hypothetical protein
VRPGASSLSLRWRLGCWLVGSAPFWCIPAWWLGAGLGWWFLIIAACLAGVLVANPLSLPVRMRDGHFHEPVLRLRPLGVIGFALAMLFFVVPFAMGEELLSHVGVRYERRATRAKPDDDDDEPTEPFDVIFMEPPPRHGFWRLFGR